MNDEVIIRQAVRNTLNFEGCTPSGGPPRYVNGQDTWKWDFQKNPTDAEVFENRVLYHFNAIKVKLAEDAWRAKQVPVDMNEVEDSYADGFETGQNWKWDYVPGGPFHFSASEYESDLHKAVAAQTQAEWAAWMHGWWDGIIDNPNCTQFRRPEYI